MDHQLASLMATNAIAQAHMARTGQEALTDTSAPSVAEATAEALAVLNRNFWLTLPGIVASAAGATLFLASILR